MNKNELFIEFLQEIKNGVLQRDHSFHILQLATFSDDYPQVRSVVLRRVETDPLKLFFHTHIESPKITELKKNAHCTVLAYCKKIKKQIRLSGQAQLITSGELYDKHTQAMTASASRCYLGPYKPSSPIEHYHPNIPEQYLHKAPTPDEKLAHYPQMVLIEFTAEKGDFLWLRAEGHVRLGAQFMATQPEVSWLAP